MTNQNIRWLQRFENLSKIFKELEKRIIYVKDIDQYLENYQKQKQEYQELSLDYLKQDVENDYIQQERILEKESILDSLIQKYEITYEMFIKTFRDLLEYQGENLKDNGNREVLKKSFQFSYIQDHDQWWEITQQRNDTVHEYHNEEERLAIVKQIIKEYYPTMKKSYQILKEKSEQNNN